MLGTVYCRDAYFSWEGIILQNVGTSFFRTKCPDASRRQLIPAVVLLEEFGSLADRVANLDGASLNIS